MSIEIFGREGHFRVTVIQIAAEIGGVAFQLHQVDAKDQKSKDHLARNPLGQIPVAKATEGYIYQTNAILRYVANISTAVKTLYGSNDFEKSQVDQWLDFTATELLPPISSINTKIWGYRDTSKEELTVANQTLSKLFTLVDTHLKGRKFFVGEAVTIADLAIYTTLVYAYRSYFDENFRNAHSGLTAWFESVAQHPNVQKYYGKTHYSSKPWF